jgi:tetratricopeptide (TPR) repeat protein
MTRHYRSDELMAYREGNDAIVNLGEVAAHLKRCHACRVREGALEAELAALSNQNLWPPSRRRPIASDAKAIEYNAMRRQMEDEDHEADAVVRQKLRSVEIESWLDRILDTPGAATAGMVRRLTLEGREHEEREPQRALEILDVAEKLLNRIAAMASMKNELAGTIWKERANARIMLGDYRKAFEAIDFAESFYETDAVAPYLLAGTSWARGNLLHEMNRYAEARSFAERAAATYREYGDETHELQVRVLLGSISYEEGDVDAAMRIFLALLPRFRESGDQLSLARIFANLGCCYLAKGDPSTAEQFGRDAARIFREFGAETEMIRTRWAYGRAYLRSGDSEKGIAWLTSVAHDFRARGIAVEAAEVELDIIVELLQRERFAEAAASARLLADFFIAAETKVNAANALQYLAQATSEWRATPELVARVRYVVSHPEQAFSTSGFTE